MIPDLSPYASTITTSRHVYICILYSIKNISPGQYKEISIRCQYRCAACVNRRGDVPGVAAEKIRIEYLRFV
jgi:hypothetical protein